MTLPLNPESAMLRLSAIIGEPRLNKGSYIMEPPRQPWHELSATLTGKQHIIGVMLYPRLPFGNPYLPDTIHSDAYISGCAIERADLADVVSRCRETRS